MYSQQVRALNLAFALNKTGKVNSDSSIAVVGAGAAGLTAAVAIARLNGKVTVLEKLHAPLGIQRGSTRRYIHPHIYDWPMSESDGNDAQLPVLDWTADYANGVIQQLENRWSRDLEQEHVWLG